MMLRGMIWRFLAQSGIISKPSKKAKSRKTKTTKKRKSKGIIKVSKW